MLVGSSSVTFLVGHAEHVWIQKMTAIYFLLALLSPGLMIGI
jgi:hypothetical protein